MGTHVETTSSVCVCSIYKDRHVPLYRMASMRSSYYCCTVGIVRCCQALLSRRPTTTVVVRWNTTTPVNSTTKQHTQQLIVYEGPFASLALRLKLVSVTSTALALVGIPFLIAVQSLSSGDYNVAAAAADVVVGANNNDFTTNSIPLAGQLAVGGSAIIGAVGSTVAMSFVFSPYVHTLEKVPIRQCHSSSNNNNNNKEDKDTTTTNTTTSVRTDQHNTTTTTTTTAASSQTTTTTFLLKATTRNILAIKVETVFDPQTDIQMYSGIRPFCNFIAKNVPMYVHPDLILDDTLRMQLVGTTTTTTTRTHETQQPRKEDPDNFI